MVLKITPIVVLLLEEPESMLDQVYKHMLKTTSTMEEVVCQKQEHVSLMEYSMVRINTQVVTDKIIPIIEVVLSLGEEV